MLTFYVAQRYACECSLTISLFILAGMLSSAHARILGDSEVFIDVGSMLNLTCVVDGAVDNPAFMLWYHGDKVRKKDRRVI